MGVRIRERPEGSGVWWVFIDHHGKRKAKKIGKDKRLAREIARKIEAKLTLGDLNLEKPESKRPTFEDYAGKWIILPHDWKESTRESYRHNLNLHIYPEFGKWQIDKIKRKDLKNFFDKLLVKGLNPSTVCLIRSSINGVLADAVDAELIESNPLNDLKLKRKKMALDIDPLTEEETLLLLEKAKEYLKGIYYPSILCALRTGLRIGEIQALQWGDLDLKGRFIAVRRSWRKGRITDTKNKKRRRVDMTPKLAETLRALRLTQKKRALKHGRPVPDWVFANEKGLMLNRQAFKYGLAKCLEKAELRKIRVHDLRHCYATIRLLKGHNIGDVSYQLGHSSISITYDVYGHWVPGKFKSEVDELDGAQPNATYTQPKNTTSRII